MPILNNQIKQPFNIIPSIKEINNDGFTVNYKINNSEINKYNSSIEDILNIDKNIHFINQSGYIMPGTGSSGMLILAIIGTLLLLIPILYISVNILKKD